MSRSRDIFVTEHAILEFFLRRTQAGTAFQNLFFLVLVQLTHPSPTELWFTLRSGTFLGKIALNRSYTSSPPYRLHGV
jgi:hypothetical protein